MRTLITILALLALSGGIVRATELSTSRRTRAGAPGSTYTAPDNEVSITQNVDPTIIDPDVSIYPCAPSGYEGQWDTAYLRRFLLRADHDIEDAFTVLRVRFAVNHAVSYGGSAAPPTQPVDINLYEIPSGETLAFANLTIVGTTTLQVPNSTELAFFEVEVNGHVHNPYVSDLVVELFTPDGSGPEQNSLWLGMNDLGQTRPWYVAAADCGIPEPMEYWDPYLHVILVVDGYVSYPVPSKTTTWGGIKALYE